MSTSGKGLEKLTVSSDSTSSIFLSGGGGGKEKGGKEGKGEKRNSAKVDLLARRVNPAQPSLLTLYS